MGGKKAAATEKVAAASALIGAVNRAGRLDDRDLSPCGERVGRAGNRCRIRRNSGGSRILRGVHEAVGRRIGCRNGGRGGCRGRSAGPSDKRRIGAGTQDGEDNHGENGCRGQQSDDA